MHRTRLLLLSSLVSSLVACGASVPSNPEGFEDGGDDAVVEDGWSGDTGASPDAASDSDDASGDGGGTCTTPGGTDSRACGKCGTQLRICGTDNQWTDWSTCSGETGACAPGATETATCVDGRTQTRTCDASCTWGPYGACMGTPTCTPGATENQACGKCGSQVRVCSTSKTWSDWSACGGEGACAAGTTDSMACGVGGTQTRTCSSSCTWGPYGSCVGSTGCTPGATSTQACGKCGSQIRVCSSASTWSDWSTCNGEGACAAGTTDSIACGIGGTQTRTCSASCTWGAYGSCIGSTGCTPGATETQSCGNCGSQLRVCSSSFTWGAWGACGGEGVCAAGSTFPVTCPAGGSGTQYCDTKCSWQTTCTASPLDVVILFDTTGSFTTATSSINKTAIMTQLVNPLLASKTYDVRVGLVGFKDIDAGEKLVEGKLVPSSSSASISAAINALTSTGGGDIDEGGVLALSEMAGGKAYATSVPLVCPAGTTLGGCFRTGAKKIVVMVSDARHHNAPDGVGGFITPYSDGSLDTWAISSTRLNTNGISVYALTDSTSSAMWGAMQTSLGATLASRVVSPTNLVGITDWSTNYASVLALIKAANPGL